MSEFEGCPKAALEAAVSGCRIVYNEAPGITEFFGGDSENVTIERFSKFDSMNRQSAAHYNEFLYEKVCEKQFAIWMSH